jgi:PadR family transcriptional regulator, regulatory protein PadR
MAKTELLSGPLDLLILRVLHSGPLHGFGIGERIHALSNRALEVEEGSLYPALYRMEAKGWIRAEWGQSERGRKAELYPLTAQGRKQLEDERLSWKRVSAAIVGILRNA